MKVMISLPMNGRSNEEIKARMQQLRDEFAKLHIEVVDSFITDEFEGESIHPGIYYLGRTLTQFMHNVDAVYFDEGWIEARGCRIENAVCQEYGIKRLDHRFFDNYESRIMNPSLSKPEQLEALLTLYKQNPEIREELYPQIDELTKELGVDNPINNENKNSHLKLLKNEDNHIPHID